MRVLLLYNASAGARTSHRRLPAAIAVLEQAGWQVESTATNTPEHAETLARTAAAAGFDIVAAAGGDGTINVVANGLAMADPDEPAAALGILPAGTGNVLARDLGLPVPVPGVLDMLPEAAHLLVRSRSMAVDLGRVARPADASGYPPRLEALVDGAVDLHSSRGDRIYFLRRLPRDPMHPDKALPAAQTWGKRSYASSHDDPREGSDVFDVFSRSERRAIDGSHYREW